MPDVPRGRVRRTAPIATLTAKAAGDRVAAALRRRLGGNLDAQLEFHLRNAERYAGFLSDSKGVLMKAGQLLSFVDSAGLIPSEYEAVYQTAFSALQADATPMDAEVVYAVVEAELGAPPEERFAEFSPTPLAAASIGQVHAARLRDGTPVAVKVQYPGAAQAIRDDLANGALLATAIRMVQGFIPALGNVDAKALVEEVSARIGEELDYVTELANQAEFADKYRGHPFIRIPEVFPEHSSASVLTMELVDGHRWDAAVKRDQAMRTHWAEVIDRFVYGSIRRFGLFNADPHPGNYLFHDDGTVTFLDFGCVKRFTPEFVAELYLLDEAVIHGRANELKAHFVRMGFLPDAPEPPADAVLEWYRPVYEPLTAPQPFTFTREFAASVVQRMYDPFGPTADVIRRFDLPKDFLFLNRIYIGLNSVLAALGATGDWRNIYEEYRVGAKPITELGEAEREFFGVTAS